MFTQNQLKKILEIAEQFYGTFDDLEQIPINENSFNRLISIHEETIKLKTDNSNSPVSWIVVIPTSGETMNLFLDKKINERELFDRAVKEKSFEALYLCSAFTISEYRNKGYAKELLIESINKFAPDKSVELYVWIYSKEGANLINVLEESLGREIKKRKNA